MSSHEPSPRQRRRIAGERKRARPDAKQAAPEGDRSTPAAPAPATPTGPSAERAARTGPTEGTQQTGEASRAGADRPSRSGGAVPVRVLAVLGALTTLLVLVAVVGVADGMGVRGYLQLREQQELEETLRSSPAAAERAAEAILAYDHQTLEADRDAAVRFMTGDYRRKYEETFRLVLENAPEVEAVVTAQVRASGVVHADPDRASVLLFVDQRTVSTAHGGEPQTALNRVVFAMEERDGAWLVDDITSY